MKKRIYEVKKQGVDKVIAVNFNSDKIDEESNVIHSEKEDFAEFIEGYNDKTKRNSERWSKYTREWIASENNDSLDLGLIKDDSIIDTNDLPDPIESGEMAITQLEEALDLLESVVKELKRLTR